MRKSGLTFAPEAGTQRLRDVINKNVTEEDLLASCRTAFAGGWSSVKLYFMLGLPTETDEDVLGIADLAEQGDAQAWRECAPNPKRGVRITVSTAWFVPKPHTAFQWEPQISMEEYQRRVKLLREAMQGQIHHLQLARSGHQLPGGRAGPGGPAHGRRSLETAWRKGAKLDAWERVFLLWTAGWRPLSQCGLDPAFLRQPRPGKRTSCCPGP